MFTLWSKFCYVGLLCVLFVAAACGPTPQRDQVTGYLDGPSRIGQSATVSDTYPIAYVPSSERVSAQTSSTGAGVLAMQAITPTEIPTVTSSCVNTPADWTPYRVQRGDNLYRIAVNHGATIQALTRANCLTNPQVIHIGQTIFVPPPGYTLGDMPPVGGSAVLPSEGEIGGSGPVSASAPEGDAMPVAITHFAAHGTVLDPGQTVRLTWVTQGPVESVQLGWLHQGLVVAERTDLPANGTVDVIIPADGRRQVPFVLQVSDGTMVASAFATVEVNCATGWFFQPAPTNVCPYPAFNTQVSAQQFDNGAIVYLPAMDRLYVLFDDEAWTAFSDGYRPGMPYRDATMVLPEGRLQPEGAIGYLWRTEPGLAERLGWATQSAIAYTGALQRAVYADYDMTYLSLPTGALYVLVEGASWQYLAPAPAVPDQNQ